MVFYNENFQASISAGAKFPIGGKHQANRYVPNCTWKMPLAPPNHIFHWINYSSSCKFISCNRLISTTSYLARIGPEHPHFIDVPGQPPFQRRLTKRDVKGILPPPRDVLKTRALQTPKHLHKFRRMTTPESKNPRQSKTDFEAWKSRMAESRKKNLRESILELHKRKIEKQKNLATLRLGRQRRREKLLHAPQQEDERLTNPTVTQLNSTLQKGFLPDPNRKQRIADMAARVKTREEAKIQARKDSLHTLYMNARYFITTKQALDARIEKIFTAEPFLKGDLNDNIWEAYGSPPTTRDLLRKDEGSSKLALEAHQSPAVLTGDRLQIIAEKLTGGKIDPVPEINEEDKDALKK